MNAMRATTNFLFSSSRKLLLFSTLFIPLFFIGCQPNEVNSKKPLIVCTTAYVADLIQQLVDTQATVTSLMGPGTDPHLYKAGQRDIALLRQADLVVYNGLRLEGKMEDVLLKIEQQKPCFAVASNLSSSDLIILGENANITDPHIWFSIPLWSKCFENCANYLLKHSEKFNLNKEQILGNKEKYLKELSTLHNETLVRFNAIPTEKRILVTAHDAFGYFGKTYGLQLKSLQGLSTLSEFSIKDKNELIDFIIDNQVRVIYTETSIPPQSIDAVIEGCKFQDFEVTKGQLLFSDAMGEQGTEFATYLGVFKHNVDAIISGFNGN